VGGATIMVEIAGPGGGMADGGKVAMVLEIP
jgi:hypothetical protein